MNEYKQIIAEILKKQYKPIYFLMGEEAFFIDKIIEVIENNILTEDEKGFNFMTLYGRDVSMDEIISHAKRFPLMSDYQLIIVKEAQELSRSIDKIESYLGQMQPTTILVFAFKYKTLDKRKKYTKIISEKGVLFESKKLYDNHVESWIIQTLKESKYGIEPKASAMLVEFLGTDLGKVNNELEKLKIILPSGSTITAHDIEQNIGISKDYNVFELRKAIGERDEIKSYKIIEYFAQNPKDNPMVVITAQIFSFFVQLLQYHGLKDKSSTNVASSLKINPFFVKDYEKAAKNYPMKKVSYIIDTLKTIDAKSKGLGAQNMSQHDLLKELLIHIYNHKM
ncbi:MAG: DNA polymerase III subunit delta [Flavobacterium sp.]